MIISACLGVVTNETAHMDNFIRGPNLYKIVYIAAATHQSLAYEIVSALFVCPSCCFYICGLLVRTYILRPPYAGRVPCLLT